MQTPLDKLSNQPLSQLQEKWAEFQAPLQAMFEEGKKQFLEGHFKAAFSWFDKVLTAKYTALRMHNRLAIFPDPALEDDSLKHFFHTTMHEVILCPLPTAGIEDLSLTTQEMYKAAENYRAENNPAQALRWYEEAARRGHSSAQYEAGKCYLLGTGIEQDVWKGIAYLLCAAIAQNTKAYNFLSVCYQDGLSIGKNELGNILLKKNEEKACQYLHATFYYGDLPENQNSAPNQVSCTLLGYTAVTKKRLPEIAKIYSMQALLLAPLSIQAIQNIKMVFEAANKQSEYYLFIFEHFKKHHVFNRQPDAILFPDAEFLEHLYDIALDEYQQGNIEMSMNLLDLVFKQNSLVLWNKYNVRNKCLTNLSNPAYLMQQITMALQKNLYFLAVCYYEAIVLFTTSESLLRPVYKDLTRILQNANSNSDEIIKRLAERALSRNGQFNLAKIYYTHLQIRDVEAKYAVIACDIKLGNQAQVKEGLGLLMKVKSPNQEDIGKRIDNFLRMADKSEKETPDEHEFIKLIGNWAFNQTWYTLAIHFYGYATNIKYDFPPAYFNMAQCYRALNDWFSARTFYAMACALDPFYLKAYLGAMECIFREDPKKLVAYWERPELQSNPVKENLQEAIIQASNNREAWAVFLVKKSGLKSDSLPISLQPVVEPVAPQPVVELVTQAPQPVAEPVKQALSIAQPDIEQSLTRVPQIAKSRKKKKITKKNDWQDLFHHCRDVPTFAALITKLEKSSFIPADVPAFVAACIINNQEKDQVLMVEIVENSGLREVMEAVQNQDIAALPVQEMSVEMHAQPVKWLYKAGAKDDDSLLSAKPYPIKRQRHPSIVYQPLHKNPRWVLDYPPAEKDCTTATIFARTDRVRVKKVVAGNEAFKAEDFQQALSCYLEAEKLGSLTAESEQNMVTCALKLAGHAYPAKEEYLIMALQYLQKLLEKKPSHDHTTLGFLEYFTLKEHYESAFIFLVQGGKTLLKLVETISSKQGWANTLLIRFSQYEKKQMTWVADYLEIKPPLPVAVEYLVGEHYEYGLRIAADFDAALHYYHRAASKKDVTALMRLAVCYENGEWGLQQDFHKALQYYRAAASQHCAHAWYVLGNLYAEGTWVEQDLDVAALCFRSAANLQDIQGQYEWGIYLAYGSIANHNIFQGQYYIEAAAFQGYEPARRWLACDVEYFKFWIEFLMDNGKYQSAHLHCHMVLQWENEWEEGKTLLAHCQDMLDSRNANFSAPIPISIPQVIPAQSPEVSVKNLVQLSLFKRKEAPQVIPCVSVHINNATLSVDMEQGLHVTPALKKMYRELMHTLLEQLDEQHISYTYDIKNDNSEKIVHTLMINNAAALRCMIDFLGQKGVNLQYVVDNPLALCK